MMRRTAAVLAVPLMHSNVAAATISGEAPYAVNAAFTAGLIRFHGNPRSGSLYTSAAGVHQLGGWSGEDAASGGSPMCFVPSSRRASLYAT